MRKVTTKRCKVEVKKYRLNTYFLETLASHFKYNWKSRETIENQRIRQVEATKAGKPEENQQDLESVKEMRANEIKNELNITKWEEKIKRNDLKYETNKRIYDFQQFKMIRSFGKSIIVLKLQ